MDTGLPDAQPSSSAAPELPFGISRRVGTNTNTGSFESNARESNPRNFIPRDANARASFAAPTTEPSSTLATLLDILLSLLSTSFQLLKLVTSPIISATEPLWRPVLDTATSPAFQRGAIGLVVFSVVFAGLIVSSTVFYGILYYVYVPERGWGVELWLQYGTAIDQNVVLPTATVDLTRYGGRKNSLLTPNQRYDIVVDLRVAESENNFGLGNFMVRAELLDSADTVVYSSSRAALVRHKSRLLRWMSTLAKAAPLILDIWTEDQLIRVPVVEKYLERGDARSTKLQITLSDPRLQTYSAHLLIVSHFTGLRYWMYHYPLSTALFVISTLVTLQSAGLFVIWRLLVLKYGVVGQELERRDGVGVASYRGTHGLDGLNLEESEESDGESSIADDDFDDD